RGEFGPDRTSGTFRSGNSCSRPSGARNSGAQEEMLRLRKSRLPACGRRVHFPRDMRHSWSRFKPVRRQQEEIDLKNALLILALVVVAVNCFYRAVSGRHEIFTGKVVELVTPDLDERILSDRSGRPWVLTLW